jgi:hypothetical protein
MRVNFFNPIEKFFLVVCALSYVAASAGGHAVFDSVSNGAVNSVKAVEYVGSSAIFKASPFDCHRRGISTVKTILFRKLFEVFTSESELDVVSGCSVAGLNVSNAKARLMFGVFGSKLPGCFDSFFALKTAAALCVSESCYCFITAVALAPEYAHFGKSRRTLLFFNFFDNGEALKSITWFNFSWFHNIKRTELK